MKYALLFILIFAPMGFSQGYDSRVVLIDTIPDTTKLVPLSGLKTSGLSVATGLASSLFGIFSLTQSVSGNFEHSAGIFAIGGLVGLVGVISGIVSLSRNHRLISEVNSTTQRETIQQTKRRSITGIIFGLLGMLVSVISILTASGVMGF